MNELATTRGADAAPEAAGLAVADAPAAGRWDPMDAVATADAPDDARALAPDTTAELVDVHDLVDGLFDDTTPDARALVPDTAPELGDVHDLVDGLFDDTTLDARRGEPSETGTPPRT